MLVVISDLHFVDGTSGNHNLPAKAFEQVFMSSIVGLAQKNKATELKLLLLGDIPDLIRSAQWFEEAPADRLWGENGLADIPNPRENGRTEQRCLDILGRFPASGKKRDVPPGSILYQNWDTFEFFRNFYTHLQMTAAKEYQIADYSIPVEIIYIVGNHDRPINLYPSLRDELQKQLGLTVTPATVDGDIASGNWWYKYVFEDAAYGVFARHGHQFDVYNYNGGSDYTREDHLQVPIGDVIATEIAVNLAVTLAKKRPEYPITDELIKAMQDADNVRPIGRLLEWFYSKIEEQDSKRVRKALDETIDEVAQNFFEIEFVQQWRNPNTHVDELIRAAANTPFRQVIDFIVDHSDASNLIELLLPAAGRLMRGKELDDYTVGAYEEEVWREPGSAIRYILYGHTHEPLLKPLDRVEDRDVIYLNTGTWRERLRRTISLDKTANFMGIKQLTYLVFYNEFEDKKNKVEGTVGFDTWTGNQQKQYAKTAVKKPIGLTPKREK